MKTVPGRTDRVVVIGAGLGGLAAALHLAGARREVTVLERAAGPGGRCGLRSIDGYQLDTGPSVLTMPDVIEQTFAAVGETMAGRLRLRRLDPAYRGHFADGSTIDVRADPEAMVEQIRETCGPADAAGYLRLTDWLAKLYQAQYDHFIDRNLETLRDLDLAPIGRLVALGGLRRFGPKVASYLPDERLQRLFTFQAMYAGLAPQRALALYAVITYLDCVQGVYIPDGGMYALPHALADAATRHGVRFRYGVAATGIELEGDRAVAVRTSAGDRMPADVVVINADLPTAYAELLDGVRPTRSRRPVRYSPSCVLMHLASGTPATAHHEISFGAAWSRTFREIIHDGQTMSDPSFLVSTPTFSDPKLAPAGRQVRHVLFPAPNLAGARPIDWTREIPAYRDHMLATLRSRGFVTDDAEVLRVRTPADWLADGLAAGTPFAAAHTLTQTGPLRASTLDPRLANVVRCGANVQPGVGVPMALISGRLAALRVTGPALSR